jgi:hypothetical protein
MRAAHHRDGVLVRLRQREQPPRRRQHPPGQLPGHAMSGQVEEAHVVGGLAQAFPQLASRVAQVHFGQRGDGQHNCHLPIISAGEAVCDGLDQHEPNRLVN